MNSQNDEIELEESISPPDGRSYLKEDGKYIFRKTLSHKHIIGANIDKKTRRKSKWIRITSTKSVTYIQILQPITYAQLHEIKNISIEDDLLRRNTILEVGTTYSNMNHLEISLRLYNFHPSQNL